MATQAADEDGIRPNKRCEIYPGGDILLLCGPDEVELQVHSIFLTNVSKVFKAMLGTHFREGQPRTDDGPREIPLPEDNPFSMRIICSVVHSCHEQLPDKISPKQLLAVAYAADKYDLVPSLTYALPFWSPLAHLKNTKPRPVPLADLWDTMIAAYVLDNAECFYRTTSEIVLTHGNTFGSPALPLGHIMSPVVIFALEQKRNTLRVSLMDSLYSEACERQSLCDCGWNAKHTHAWMQTVKLNSLFPKQLADKSLERVFQTIENFKEAPVSEKSTNCVQVYVHRKVERRWGLVTEMDKLKKDAGVCIDCFENVGKTGRRCRVQHS